MKSNVKRKEVILKGEGANQHVLYGKFTHDTADFGLVQVLKETYLKHETPNGVFAEHNTLVLEPGDWSKGLQVEFNPFDKQTTRVWD